MTTDICPFAASITHAKHGTLQTASNDFEDTVVMVDIDILPSLYTQQVAWYCSSRAQMNYFAENSQSALHLDISGVYGFFSIIVNQDIVRQVNFKG